MITVTVNGVNYQIPSDRVNEVVTLLESLKVTSVLDNRNPNADGKTVING